MALKIDPTKIHLGDTQYKYYAEYLPAYNAQEEKPEACVLPPLTNLTLTPVSFKKVEEVCVFTFPDVTPVPPVYNPPIVPGGCVDFLANSTFVIKAPLSGTLTLDSDGPPACGITIGGEIAMPSGFCEEITTSVEIDGLGKAQPGVSLSFSNSGAPDCALELTGSITVDACVELTSSAQISVSGNAVKRSDWNLERVDDNCGFVLVGDVEITACPEISAGVNITTSGNNPPKLALNMTPTDDGCGFELNGNIELDACPEIKASVNITTSGTNPPEVDLSMLPTDNGCGFELYGNIALDACVEITSAVNITTSGTNPPTLALNMTPTNDGCGFELNGNIALDACKQISSSVNITTSGTNPPEVDLSMMPSDDGCGFELYGNIALDACVEITSDVNITTSGTNPPKLELSMVPTNDGCGFELNGNIELDACKEISAAVNITTSGTNPPEVDLSFQMADDGCGFELNGNIAVDACKEITSDVNITTSGTNPPKLELSMLPTNEGCGFELNGNIELDACKEFSFNVNSPYNSANVTFTQGSRQVGTLDLTSTLSVTSTNEGCGAEFALEMSPLNTTINLPPCEAASEIKVSGLYITQTADSRLSLGGTIDVNIAAQVAGMYLGTNSAGGLELQGELTTSCSEAPSSLILDQLQVRLITPPYPCCSPECHTTIEMCSSTMYMKTIYTSELLPHCGGGAYSFSFISGEMTMENITARSGLTVGDGLCTVKIGENIHIVCSEGTTTINGGSISMTGSGGSFTLSPNALGGKTAGWQTITLCDNEGKKMTAMVFMTPPEYVTSS
jgi:hypothetical protein